MFLGRRIFQNLGFYLWILYNAYEIAVSTVTFVFEIFTFHHQKSFYLKKEDVAILN